MGALKVFGDVSKEDIDTRCTFPDNMNYNNYSLEVLLSKQFLLMLNSSMSSVVKRCLQIFSPLARCFDLAGDGGIAIKSDQGTYTWIHNVGCFEVNVLLSVDQIG